MTKKEFMAANIDPEEVAALLRRCAQEIILPYHRNLSDEHINFKRNDPNNKVTIADHKSEEFLTEALQNLLPGSYVVGEEAAEDDPDILSYLDDPQKTAWVIDPIDGTGNFARGDETFCVIVALVMEGETRMGWIYDVCNDSMAFARKGGGAFVDGRKIKIDPEAEPENPTGYAGHKFKHKLHDISLTTLRCSGLEYFRMAKGEALFSLYSYMKPWDHLAGVLLVQEAGGIATKWDHSTYRPNDDRGGLITAANETIWQKARDAIPEKSLRKHGIDP